MCAHVRNPVDLTRGEPAIARAGDEVCRLAAQLAAEAPQSAELIRHGVYPPVLHNATQAVERFRAAMVRSLEQLLSTS